MKKLLILLALCSVNAFAAPVNINTADAKTIADSLSGIGLKKAQAIIDYRTKNGNFKSIDDLSQVSGIGTKTIEKNKTDILLNDTSTPAPAPSDSSKQTPQAPVSETVTKPVEKKK
ncbi:MAG: helix-hairpin-helix domain-containing protein [Methylococcaceae bacterium]|nr:helix-hairpin-helix domain-containing protein [Methylococcaceae bacterium]